MRRVTAAALLTGLFAGFGPAQAQTEIIGSIWFPDTHPLTKYGYLDWSKQVDAVSIIASEMVSRRTRRCSGLSFCQVGPWIACCQPA